MSIGNMTQLSHRHRISYSSLVMVDFAEKLVCAKLVRVKGMRIYPQARVIGLCWHCRLQTHAGPCPLDNTNTSTATEVIVVPIDTPLPPLATLAEPPPTLSRSQRPQRGLMETRSS